jgi:hypothetical protein
MLASISLRFDNKKRLKMAIAKIGYGMAILCESLVSNPSFCTFTSIAAIAVSRSPLGVSSKNRTILMEV